MTHNSIKSYAGAPFPLGCSLNHRDNSINFALFSAHAQTVTLGIFKPGSIAPEYTFPLHQTDNHWHVAVSSLPKGLLYGYQCDTSDWLLDPYATIIDTTAIWGHAKGTPLLGLIETIPVFDWEGTAHPILLKRN